MKHEPDKPATKYPDSGYSEESDRLAEIERRLKAARPRPPSLDPVTLLRIASGGGVDAASERRSVTADHVCVERPTPAYRWWTALAGSWICGAAVGVLVTLMLVSRPAADVDSADAMVRQKVRVPEPTENVDVVEETSIPEDDGASEIDQRPEVPVRPPDPRPRDDSLIATIADPRGAWPFEVSGHGGILRVGMLYRRTVEALCDVPPESWDMDKPSVGRAELAAPDAKRIIDFEPPAPITRGRMMEELLYEASRHGVL